MKTEELGGVVSLDLTKSPQMPKEYSTIESVAKSFQVKNEEDYTVGANMISGAAANISKVEAFFEEDKALAHRLHKSICDKISTITAPWRSVRAHVYPKMVSFREAQEKARRAAELRAQQEEAERQRAAQVEAQRIAREAAEAAEQLRQAGQMRLAREREEAAQVEVSAVVQQAEDFASIGTILPATRPMGGPSERRPWIGEVVDIKAICRAIAEGKIPLEYNIPGRLDPSRMLPLISVNTEILNYLAKRMGREDIGVPGARGSRALQLAFGKSSAMAAGIKPDADAGEDW